VHERQQQWQAIVDASQQMQTLASEQRWDEVILLETQRRSELEKFFSQPVTADEVTYVAEGIQKILTLDQEIMARGNEARADAGKHLSAVHQGRRAEAAYHENS